MLTMMRTTINLDAELLRLARHRAVDRGMSLSEFVAGAVRDAVETPARGGAERPFQMVTWGEGERSAHVSPEQMHAADVEHERRTLRR
jgi:Arc/MetJ family transcription regulator